MRIRSSGPESWNQVAGKAWHRQVDVDFMILIDTLWKIWTFFAETE
jgi:hypothetical protein